MSEGSERKKNPASQEKLRKQRKKGSVPSSQESSAFMSAAFGIAFIFALSSFLWIQVAKTIENALGAIDLPFQNAVSLVFSGFVELLLLSLFPMLVLTLCTAFLVAIVYNNGFTFSVDPVKPKMNRVSFVTGFKRIYGRRGLVELSAATIRLFSWVGAMVVLGVYPLYLLAEQSMCDGLCLLGQIKPIFVVSIILAIIFLLIASIFEMMMQKKLFLHEQKMTDSEVKKEQKDQFGSPEINQERERLRDEQEDESERAADLSKATLCFFYGEQSVAIEFRPPEVVLPHVMAKAATGEKSAVLKERLAAAGMPVVENKTLTAAGMARGLGQVLDRKVFMEFVQTVEALFSKNK